MFTIELSELEICQIAECLILQIFKFETISENMDEENEKQQLNNQIKAHKNVLKKIRQI